MASPLSGWYQLVGRTAHYFPSVPIHTAYALCGRPFRAAGIVSSKTGPYCRNCTRLLTPDPSVPKEPT